ncbi:MAG: hypothetical protein HOE86_13555, partial [Gemmatimonadetes bacterium]|nr:hypothetical protein [Gemmatimonadota bacterium]
MTHTRRPGYLRATMRTREFRFTTNLKRFTTTCRMAMFRKSALLLTILTLLNPELVAAQRGARGTAAEGRVLFHSPSLSTNGLACINCHSDFDETREPDGR